ncbi:MAG: dihydroorotate dehydrogenase-like protein [Fimbriimonas sp.]|nr:dihydroorotate dehydrogenase-like protein [Fimbriimonas sp.]
MNLTTTYLGLTLRNPIVPASSPLSRTPGELRRMEDAGAGAVTLFSLFEEQIEHETEMMGHYLDYGAESYSESLSFFPPPESYHRGPEQYLELIRKGKESLEVPVIASLNGASMGGWTQYAKEIEQAGADALELNIYWIETDPLVTSNQVDERYREIVAAVAGAVKIPVTVKIGPYFSSLPNLAKNLYESGAHGMVLFNRFYQPDFDVEAREVRPKIEWSSSYELRLPLHWVALLSDWIDLDFAVSSGVHNRTDVVKAMMAGAKVATCASVLLDRGVEYVGKLVSGLEEWLESHEYTSVAQMQGSMSYKRVANPSAFKRANYMKELQSFPPPPPALRR